MSSNEYMVHCEWPVDIDGRRIVPGPYAHHRIAAWDSAIKFHSERPSAIRSAKALHRIHGTEVTIAYDGQTIAKVTSDAYGRVWVDAMIYGSTLV
jgi:hypothetical protein